VADPASAPVRAYLGDDDFARAQAFVKRDVIIAAFGLVGDYWKDRQRLEADGRAELPVTIYRKPGWN
jgi:hypothetical protein